VTLDSALQTLIDDNTGSVAGSAGGVEESEDALLLGVIVGEPVANSGCLLAAVL
jgi:hypothetical protein